VQAAASENPHEAQNRAPSGVSTSQDGQGVDMSRVYGFGVASLLSFVVTLC
jgi:hypothetical protein